MYVKLINKIKCKPLYIQVITNIILDKLWLLKCKCKCWVTEHKPINKIVFVHNKL